MLTSKVLRGNVAVLRPFRRSDTDDIVAGCSDPLTQRFLPLLPFPYTAQDARWWIDEGAPGAFAAGGAGYAIADPRTDRLLGAIGINRVVHGSGEIGYWVAPWGRGFGAATDATRTLALEAFRHGVARLDLHTEPENIASQRVAIAAGFTREGLRRSGGLGRDGSRHDQIVWARLAGEPEGPARRRLPDLPGGELTDGVVRLRPLGPEDADDQFALNSLPDVVASSVPPRPPSREHIAQRCAREQSTWLAGDQAHMTIRDARTDAYAGDIALYFFEPETGQAMIGYSLMPAWRGQGYATRAARLVSAWAFEQVGIARLIAGTAPDNVGSQRVLERAGFRREGYQRDRLPGPDGTRIDDLLYALLPGDPRGPVVGS
jgi:RimJ/RimL family protein N-acetyltransferase